MLVNYFLLFKMLEGSYLLNNSIQSMYNNVYVKNKNKIYIYRNIKLFYCNIFFKPNHKFKINFTKSYKLYN